jgi:hypothetical protein
MSTKSRARKALEAHLEQLDRIIANPSTPSYIVARAISTATKIRIHDERQRHERLLAAKARKATDERPIFNVLPSNGREPKDWKPSAPVPAWEPPSGINRS